MPFFKVKKIIFLFVFCLYFVSCATQNTKNHYILAEKLWNSGKYKAAVREFEKVIEKNPNSQLGLQALFRAAMTQTLYLEQHQEAIIKFETYIKLSENVPVVWESQKHVGDILYSKQENFEKAADYYRNLLKLRPRAIEAPEFLYKIGKSLFYLWRFKEAIHAFNGVIKTNPRSPWSEKAHYEIGVTYFTKGHKEFEESNSLSWKTYERAISSYKEFVDKHPNSLFVPQARFGIASCFEAMEKLQEAYNLYEELEKTYPSPNVIKIKLVRIKERMRQRNL